MAVDVQYNTEIVRNKFDQYLDEMMGEDSLAYEHFVGDSFWTRGIRKGKIDKVHSLMETQRDILLEYAQECAMSDTDAKINRDLDEIFHNPQTSDEVNTYGYVNEFLRTNPFLTEFSIDRRVEREVQDTLAQHFFYVSDELGDLISTELPAGADDEFGTLVKETYPSYEHARDALHKNFAYTEQLQDYKDHISLGWVEIIPGNDFSKDVWPVLREGEKELSEQIDSELKEIYA